MWIWWRLDLSLAPLHYHRIRCVRSRCTCQRRWWPAALEVVATLKEAAVDSVMAVGSVVVEVAWAALMLVVEMCERAFDAITQAMRGRAARSTARRIACFRGARGRQFVHVADDLRACTVSQSDIAQMHACGEEALFFNQTNNPHLLNIMFVQSTPLGISSSQAASFFLSQDHNLWCSLSHLHSL